MNIIDFKILVDFANEHKDGLAAAIREDESISTELSKIRNNKAFLEHTLATLAKIVPVNFSIKDTFATCDPDLKQLLMFLVSYPFSNISRATQTTSEINSATPLFLYAQKLYNNIPYSAWVRDDYLQYGLSRELRPILGIEFPVVSEENWNLARVSSVTDGEGKRHDFSAYKCNKTSSSEINALPRFFRHMYLRTWIFAEPKASMIISLDNFDSTIPPKLYKSVSFELPF